MESTPIISTVSHTVYCTVTSVHFIVPIKFSSAAPVVTSLKKNTSSSHFTLICISTTSPATTVVWTKNGTNIGINETAYQSSQRVINSTSSTYQNTLVAVGDDVDFVGNNFTCTVSNRFGSSSTSLVLKG